METITEGLDVVTPDDQKIGRILGVSDDCVLVETGHLRKTRHAVPREFLHPQGDVVKATLSKEIVEASPRIEDDDWSCESVLVHYGLAGPTTVDPDPDSLDNAETEGERAGVEPAPHARTRTLDESEKPSYVRPAVRDRQGNANDPGGATASLE